MYINRVLYLTCPSFDVVVVFVVDVDDDNDEVSLLVSTAVLPYSRLNNHHGIAHYYHH